MKGCGYCFLFSLMVVLAFHLSGCSNAHRHKTLSFFFDGVPDTAEMKAVQRTDSSAAQKFTGKKSIPTRQEITKLNYHMPYGTKQCGSCHEQGAMGKSKKPQPALCYQCHEDFGAKYKKVHGPAGGGYCTLCHNPHMGDNKQFLIRKGQQLCLYCHDAGQVLKNEAHRAIADVNCTECHNPHGGDDSFMLKQPTQH